MMPTPKPVEQSSFDMRLEYYQSIGELLRASNMFVSLGDYDSWHRSLLMLVNNHPFMTKEKLDSCDASLAKAKSYLALSRVVSHSTGVMQQRSYYRSLAVVELSNVHRVILRAYQDHHMLLPEKKSDDDKSDTDIAKEMGL